MLNQKTVAVVISAYNEGTQLSMVVDSMPEFVDRIVIINDCSKDNTAEVALKYVREFEGKGLSISLLKRDMSHSPYNKADQLIFEIFDEETRNLPPFKIHNRSPEIDKIILIDHLQNSGKGAAVATGYDWCRRYGIDCTVTIDGDGQMDPSEMEKICLPIVTGEVDFVKGNRLSHRAAHILIPSVRFFGNSVLSILTKVASGYWGITDTQTGYTSIGLKAMNALKLDKIYRRYGVPNDILVKLNINRAFIKEVDIKPVYGVGEQSKMKVLKVIPKISWLLVRCFFKRILVSYLLKSFHPLFLLYAFGLLMLALAIIFIGFIGYSFMFLNLRPPLGDYFALLGSGILAFQAISIAMWMDIEDNKKLIR
jgi:glycosyltransferase involved in cell wall biosynthesis